MKFSEIKEKIRNLEHIGKGWRGNVYKGIFNNDVLSFKVASRPEVVEAIKKEGEILKEVNKAGIGGKLIIEGEDFIAYRFIEGKHLIDVLSKENYKNLLFQLFLQARKLDEIGINKDEMQRPLKNVLVDKNNKIYLIDFERAKFSKKPSNITQLLQFVLSLQKDYFNHITKEKIINLGKEYKANPSEKNFQKILKEVFEK